VAKAGIAELPDPDLSIETLEGQEDELEEESSEDEGINDIIEYGEEGQDLSATAEGTPFGEWSERTAAKKPFQVVLYGPPGGGKTHYAGTFPRPLFIDMENGLRTTLKLGPVLRWPKDPNKKILVLDQVRQAYADCRSAKNPPFETIVLDSLQELQVLVTAEVLGVYKNVARQMGDQLTYQDYGKINRTFLQIVRAFLNLPYHIVMTSVQTEAEYETSLVYPSFSGKGIWKDLQRIVEQIGYVTVRKNPETGKDEHMVSYHLSPTFIAKDRIGIREKWLPNRFDALLKYSNQARQSSM